MSFFKYQSGVFDSHQQHSKWIFEPQNWHSSNKCVVFLTQTLQCSTQFLDYFTSRLWEGHLQCLTLAWFSHFFSTFHLCLGSLCPGHDVKLIQGVGGTFQSGKAAHLGEAKPWTQTTAALWETSSHERLWESTPRKKSRAGFNLPWLATWRGHPSVALATTNTTPTVTVHGS